MNKDIKKNTHIYIFNQKKDDEWKVIGYKIEEHLVNNKLITIERKGCFMNKSGIKTEVDIDFAMLAHCLTILKNPEINNQFPIRIQKDGCKNKEN